MLEEATPLSEMVSQLNTKEMGTKEIKGIDLKRKKNKPTDDTADKVEHEAPARKKKKAKRKKAHKDLPSEKNDLMEEDIKTNNDEERLEATDDTVEHEASARKKKKAKSKKAHKDLTSEKNDLMEEDIKTNNDEGRLEAVLFQGYWVTKEGAAKLTKLEADLTQKGVSEGLIWKAIKGERRRQEKALWKETKRVCLRCRKRGHMVNKCPEDIGVEQNCICYACGSTEHKVSECPQAGDQAVPPPICFICQRVGHISRQCPDNPRH